ncbi:hypothetical protein ANN_11491 [Periplaneta americana]|uniref:Mos1 transposase HTH domain-containing protein n=1 Tax=Periplaneta americana TaxID=6978 RepID=A0ABQ8T6P3_PERAM|nr:hypothetical protein ANN_11491 [Periplaneta americana]
MQPLKAMTDLCEGGNEPPGSLKAISQRPALGQSVSDTRGIDSKEKTATKTGIALPVRNKCVTSKREKTFWLLAASIIPDSCDTAIVNIFSKDSYCESPKTTFTKLEQRSWIKIEVTRGRSAQECFQGLHADAALPYRRVARWVKAFREGRDVKVMFIVAYDIDGVKLHHADISFSYPD